MKYTGVQKFSVVWQKMIFEFEPNNRRLWEFQINFSNLNKSETYGEVAVSKKLVVNGFMSLGMIETKNLAESVYRA